GLFDNDKLRAQFLLNLAARKGVTRGTRTRFDRDLMYDQLAEIIRAHLDLRAIYRLMQ
ncbi:MAG: cobyric acid synthase CobQ, partial [Chloroflexi bacterium]|nr:cobyric acid synthase CobQ [Chloroflexota bacterium]